MKTHIYCLDILIQTVKIEIKFPCSITVAFKLGKQQVQTHQPFKLQNGEAIINQSLTIKTSLSYNIQQRNYAQRKGIMTIHVVSSSGKNVAGILYIDVGKILNQLGNGVDIDRNLERCPDKNARIKMRVVGRLLEETDQIQDPSSANLSFYSSTVNQNRQNSSQSTYKRTSILDNSQTPNRQKFTSAEHYLQVNPSHSNHSGHSIVGYRTSRVERVQAFQPGFHTRTNYDSAMHIEMPRREEGDKTKTISEMRIDIVEKDRKITRLEIQKTSFQKECDLLKIQITNQKNKYQVKANKESQLTFENERLSKKIVTLQSALETYKIKPELRRLESFSTKFSSEELAHRSERLDELQAQYKNIKLGKEETERLLRESKKQTRELYQKSQDLQNSLTTLSKRLQMKQTFYKDQLKKYNDKILEFETLKIQLSNQNYFLKSQFDESERKLNQSIKQKQKLLGEEKYKQNRKNQQAQSEIQALNTQIQQLTTKLTKLTHDNQQLQFTLRQRSQQKTYFQQQIDRLNHQLIQNQSIYKQRYNNQLLLQRKQLQQKHRYKQQQFEQLIKSKISQLQNSNRIMLDKSEHVQAFNLRLNETQKKMKEKEQKIIELTQSFETVSKRLELVKANEDKLSNQVNEYKVSYNKLKIELDRVDKQRRELSQYNYQSKQHQNHLLIELKNMMKTLTEQLEFEKSTNRILEEQKMELINENRKLKEKTLSLTLSLNQVTEKQNRQVEELNRKKELVRQLENENDKIKTIISEQKQMLDQQNARSYSLQARITKLEQQTVQMTILNDQIRILETVNKQKQAELKLKLQNQTNMQVHIQKQQYQIQSLKDQLKIRVNEVQNEKYVSQSVRREINMVKQQSDVIKRDNHTKFQQISRLQFQNNRSNNELKNITDRYHTSQQQFKKYKQKYFNSFLKFFNSMSSDQHIPFNVTNLELDDLIHNANIKLKSIKEFNDKEAQQRIESMRLQISRIKTEAEDMERSKEQSNMELYHQNQSIEQNFKFYKESMRLKELQTEQEIANLTDKLRGYADELNHSIVQKEQISIKYHQELLKSEELSVYLEQAQREINRIVEEKNSVIEELEHEKKNNVEYLKRVNQEGNIQFQERENKLKVQLSQNEKSDKQKKKTIQTLQSQIKTHNRQIQQKMELLRITEKNNEDLRKQMNIINTESQNNFKKQKQLHEKVRNLEQSVVLTEQRQSQSSIFNQLRQKEIDEIKYHFDKEKQQLLRKLSQLETDLKSSQVNNEIKVNSLTQQNIFLKQRVAKSSKYTDQEYRKKDQQIVSLTKDILVKRNQITTLQNQFNEYKRQTQNNARLIRDELQKSLFSIDNLQKKISSMSNQLKFMQDKCTSLQSQKRKILQDLTKSKPIPSTDYQSLRLQNQRIRSQISQLSNRYSLQIIQLKKCKQGLLSQIQQLIIRHKQKSRQTAQYYDKEIRQMTARMVSIQNDADEKVKRAYREKYEDRAALEFEIQCLRQELSKYTEVRVERNTHSRNEFIIQSSQSKMKLFLSQQPLRNIQSWIPTLLIQIQQYQQTIYTHQKLIKQLQSQLDSTTKTLQSHISPNRPIRSSRKSTFFPQSIVNETFKDGSSIVQKLQEIMVNVQIALRKVQEMGDQLESVTQDKCILLTKTREVYGGLVMGKVEVAKGELKGMMDYSKVETGSFYMRVSKPN